MKKKWIALLSLAVMLLGLLALAKPMAAQAATGKLRVGYAAVSLDPVDKAGTYRNVDYTYIFNSSGNETLKKNLAEAGYSLENPIYTVPTVAFDCDGNGTTDDGYFSVPLAGYGSTYNRMSAGKMDDNGDGKIDSKDGVFVTCIAVTDAQDNTVLFFSMDLIAANNSVVADARTMIQTALLDTYGYIPQSQMMFTASHSHSSPDVALSNSAPLNSNAAQRAYLALIKDRFVQAAQQAMADRCEATASRGSIEAINMNSTRHYNIYEEKTVTQTVGGVTVTKSSSSASWVYGDNFGRGLPVDENLDNSPIVTTSGQLKTTKIYQASNVSVSNDYLEMVQFTPTDGDAPIVMVNFRAHPKLNSTNSTQYGKDNRDRSSGDYAVMLREKLQKYGYRASFVQGAAGNQNTWNYIDDGVLSPRATNSYDFVSTYHEPVVDKTTTQECYNDRMSFVKYYSSTTRTTTSVQTGYSYGGRLADYAIAGLKKNMQPVTTDLIKADQYYFSAQAQTYSDGLKAAVAAYDADAGASFPYMYKHTDGKYYNLNSVYHANSVRSRNTDANAIDAKLEIDCITIGEIAFLTAPNELYDRYNLSGNQTANNLWDNLNDEGYGVPIFMGYTNGSEGYIPNVAAYEYNRANNDKGEMPMVNGSSYVVGVGAYEANTSTFASGAGEALCRTFEKMLQSMKTLNRPTTCPMCGAKGVQWQALFAPDSTRIDTGHYYLADDLNHYARTDCYQKTIYSGNSVCIDLNGRTVENSSNKTGRAFNLENGAILRMMNGRVRGRGHSAGLDGGVINLSSNATLELTNVDIVRDTYEGQSANNGGAIYMGSGATLKISGGSVTGGNATASGGAIYAYTNCNVTLKDVTISGGSAVTGGNLCFAGGVNADLENVTLEAGTASGNGDNLAATLANVHIYGNSVIKGECYFDGGTPKLSGNVKAWQSSTGVNIKLNAGTKLTFGTLESTAKIGLTGKAMVTDATGVQYASQLVADSGYLDATFDYGIFAGEHRGCECRGKATGRHTCQYHAWTAWTSTTSLPTVGNYYLSKDVTVTEEVGVHSTLRLDLNGKTITRKVSAPETTGSKPTQTRLYYLADEKLLTITDSTGAGKLNRNISALSAAEKAQITDYGLIVCLGGNAEFRMYAGKLDGQGQQTRGGTVAGTKPTTRISIYGGTVSGVTAKYIISDGRNEGGNGGVIYSQGAVNLYGGTLTGGSAEMAGGGVYLSSTGALLLTGDACVTGNTNATGAANNIRANAANLTVSGTYTGTAGIVVSDPAEGKLVGMCNSANLTGAKLTVDGYPDYKFIVSGTQLKITTKNMEAFITSEEQTQYYESLEAALAAYPGETAVLHLTRDIDRNVTVTANTVLELAGCSIKGSITLENNAILSVYDSNTDDYTVADGTYGTVPAVSGIRAADGYLMVQQANGLSFHKLGLDLTSVNLRPEEVGIYYGGCFSADELAAPKVLEFGIALGVGAVPTEQQILADTDNKMHYAYTAGLQSGTQVTGVLVQNIMQTKNTYAVNKYNAGAMIYGVAYVKTDDGMILGDSVCYSLRQVVEAADGRWSELSQPQKEALLALYKAYDLIMYTWDLKNIQDS